MIIGDKTVVSIHYTLTNDNGDVMDQSQDGQPLVYLHGAAGLIPGLENELTGKAIGGDFKVSVKPEEAYGERHEEMVQEVPRASFPEDAEIVPGMQFSAESPNGPMTVTVIKADADNVTVDGNHPLAGLTLHFEGKIADVRPATNEELDHGHVH